MILQHVGERFHRFNTARIVRKALRNCQLIADHNRRLAAYDLPIQANAGLLPVSEVVGHLEISGPKLGG